MSLKTFQPSIFLSVPVALCLLNFVDSHSLSLYIPSNQSLNPIRRAATSTQDCGFQGNSDVYGLGIRIGLYTQSLAAWLGTFFVCREGLTLRSVNTLFAFAMLGGLFNLTANARTSHAAEAFLLLQICLFSSYISFMESSAFTKKKRQSSNQQVYGMTAVMWMSFAYNVWFWWAGLDHFQRTPCGTFGFWYYKCNLYGDFRTVQKAFAVLLIVYDVPIRAYILATRGDDWYTRRLDSNSYKKYLTQLLQRAKKETLFSPGDQQRLVVPRRSSYPTSAKERTNLLTSVGIEKLCANTKHSSATSAIEIFRNIYKTDKIITTVISTWPTIGFPTIRPSHRTAQFLSGHAGITFPRLLPLLRIYHTTLTTTFRAIATHTYKRRTFRALALLVSSQHRHDRDALVFLHTAALLHPRYQELDEHWVAVLTLMEIARMPKRNPWGYWSLSALQGAALCVGLVLSVELTLLWNNVQGLQGIGTVGQLIPFIVGVGGLMKVINTGFKNCWRRRTVLRYNRSERLDVETTSTIRRTWEGSNIDEELADAYFEAKDVYEKLSGEAQREEKERSDKDKEELERRLRRLMRV